MRSFRAHSSRQFANRLRAVIRRIRKMKLLLAVAFAMVIVLTSIGFKFPNIRQSSRLYIIEESHVIGIEDTEFPSRSRFHTKEFNSVEDGGHGHLNWKRTATNLTKVQEEWSENYDIGRSLDKTNSSEFETEGDLSVETFHCNRSHPRVDICHMRGDVRVKGGPTPSCNLLSSNKALHRTEEIQPYPRKWEPTSMKGVQVVRLQGDGVPGLNGSGPGLCDVQHQQPALLFSSGGFSGNIYHDFNDVLIPLFISSYHHKGQIIFLVTDFKDWWILKYINIVRQLSNYDIVDLGTDERVHCFRHITVGLTIHGELQIDPDLLPHRDTIHDFQNLVARAFKDSSAQYDPIWQTIPLAEKTFSRPKLVILDRLNNRMIVNLDEVLSSALQIGFDVQVFKPVWETNLNEIYHVLQAADVMLGVHGAALTHFLFLRPGSVFLQIIPIGLNLPAAQYFGDPAAKLGLQYMSYKVRLEESTLNKTYNVNDPIIKDSDSIADESWEVRRTTYMEGQDVRLSVERIAREMNWARLLAM